MKIDEKYFSIDEKNMQANTIDDILEENENILWRDKPNKKAYITGAILQKLPFVILWLIFDIAFVVGAVITAPSPFVFIIIPFIIIHLAPVWIWIANLIKSTIEIKNIDYAFTEKRILIRSGVIGIDIKSIYYSDISSVNVKVGIVDRILKVGDIYIKASTKAQVLYDIKNPYFIGEKLQKIALDIKTDINFPNAYRPDENPGYNTKYTANNKNDNQ